MDSDKVWYMGFADDEERTEAIFDPKTAQDYLDQKRVDYINDHFRVYRVFLHKKIWCEQMHIKWDFRNFFATSHYKTFINNLSPDDKNKCQKITYGDMYSSKVNAFAYPHDKWGEFVSVNIAVKFFAYYMLLALVEPLKYDIPEYVICNSLRIALRTWLGCESLDFEMDPRGIVPKEIDEDINSIIPNILVFIAGHEFSHHLLGHCDKNDLRSIIMWGKDEKNSQKIYNTSQQQEFDADLGSLNIPNYPPETKKAITESAMLWYLMLDIVEYSLQIINPFCFDGYQTHPLAKDRFEYIRNHTTINELAHIEYFKGIIDYSNVLKEVLKTDIAENYGDFYDEEAYGSVYLAPPNTKWRGRELKDRVDY